MAWDMFGIGQRPEPPVLKRDGFELCDNSFTITGFRRQEGKRLRELFNPEIRKTGQLKTAKEAKKLFKKSFFAAQLKYYDIKFKSSSKVDDLRNLLEESVRQGKCNRLPESTAKFQRQMLSAYQPMRQKWEDDIRAWEEKKRQLEIDLAARIEKQKEDDWNRCTTPQQRADCNLKWFMDYHYLTDGKPDRTKTPQVVVYPSTILRGVFEELVPGLHIEICRTTWGGNCLCVGWDRSAVLRVAQAKNEEADEYERREEEEKQKQRDAEWEKTSQPHSQYIHHSAAKLEPQQSFDLQRCVGSHIIRCDKFCAAWDVTNTLTIDIFVGVDGTLIATYDFSIIEGTMLLALSEAKLDDLSVELDAKYESADEEYGYGYGGDEYGSSFHQDATGKRAAPAPKRPESTPPVPRRVYFRMRGRETGEDEMFYTPELGHFDFVDNTCTKFAGLFYQSTWLGSNTPFEGYKVADQPRARQPEEWQEFSERAYDRAARRRW